MPDALAAFRDGMRRVNRAPAILFGMWTLTIALAALGALEPSTARIDLPQMRALAAFTTDAGVSFAERQVAVTFAAANVALWIFLAGGVVDRYGRDRPTRAFGFFGVSGTFFFRFLRLAIVLLPLDALLVRASHATAVAAVPAIVGAAFNLVAHYAIVRAVVEDRRSMLGAIGGAFAFLRRNAVAVVSLYVLDAAAFAALVAIGERLALQVGSGAALWAAGPIAGIYVGFRLWIKLLFFASETSLFQTRLAHAGYVARAEPAWPDSPVAEAIS